MNKIKILNELQNLIPKLSEEEYKQLEANVKKDGCLDPLITASINGYNEPILIDGHNRYKICNANKIAYYTKNIELNNIDDAKIWVIKNQFGRRNISSFVRIELTDKAKEIIASRAKENQGKRTDLEPFADIGERLDTREELAKMAKVGHDTMSKYNKIKANIKDESVFEDLRSGKKTINKVYKSINNAEKQSERKKALQVATKNYKESEDIKIYFGDCLKVTKDKIEPNSVDVIITDPPYPYEFIECWSKLSELADYALKPSGLCIAMSGQLYLPEVMDRLGKHLNYYWTMCVQMTAQKQIVHPVNIQCGWKPILIYQKAPKKKISYCPSDFLTCDPKEVSKQDHEWQQPLKEYEILIDRFSEPGQLVLEPFAGSGTTLAACKNLKRRVIGIELDKSQEATIKGRLVYGV